jgi:predicted glycosyltransferase
VTRASSESEAPPTVRPHRHVDASCSDTGSKIAIYTHDTFGLGHVRRCLHIVGAICRRDPSAAVLLITGSPALHALGALPANADYLKIPTIAKTGDPRKRPPHLPIAASDLIRVRKHVVRAALESLQPDVVLVDNFPLGSSRELLPTLERLRARNIPAVLGLRDIVDRPETVRRDWERSGVYDVLERLYDRILVYGAREVLDVEEAYALPLAVASKVHYCGYVTAPGSPRRPREEVLAELGLEPPLVLATVGGGGDGVPLLSAFLRAARRLDHVSALAVTGPLMSAVDREEMRALALGHRRIVVKEHLVDLPSYFAAADLVVAMGGYNTAAELVAIGRRTLMMPRNWRYGEYQRGTDAGSEWEQLLRAQALERLGAVEVLDPDAIDSSYLATRIQAALADTRQAPVTALDLGGVERVVESLLDLASTRRSHG